MGYPNSDHIKKFCTGRVIADISQEGNRVWLAFSNGEKLRLEWWQSEGRHIATPFRTDGEVKQSTEIMRKIRTYGSERDADCEVHPAARATYLQGMRDADLARIESIARERDAALARIVELEDHFRAYVEMVVTVEKLRDDTAAERDAARKERQSLKDAHSVASFDRDAAKVEAARRLRDCDIYLNENKQLRKERDAALEKQKTAEIAEAYVRQERDSLRETILNRYAPTEPNTIPPPQTSHET